MLGLNSISNKYLNAILQILMAYTAYGFTQGSPLPPIQCLDNLVVQIHRVKVIFERPSHMDTG